MTDAFLEHSRWHQRIYQKSADNSSFITYRLRQNCKVFHCKSVKASRITTLNQCYNLQNFEIGTLTLISQNITCSNTQKKYVNIPSVLDPKDGFMRVARSDQYYKKETWFSWPERLTENHRMQIMPLLYFGHFIKKNSKKPPC